MAQQVAVALGNARRFAEVNRLYAELQRTHEELRRAERMRNDFTNMIVHDLRSPLTAVVGSLNLAQRMFDRGGTVPSSLFERANSASEQIGNMIDTMLDVSKLEAGENDAPSNAHGYVCADPQARRSLLGAGRRRKSAA